MAKRNLPERASKERKSIRMQGHNPTDACPVRLGSHRHTRPNSRASRTAVTQSSCSIQKMCHYSSSRYYREYRGSKGMQSLCDQWSNGWLGQALAARSIPCRYLSLMVSSRALDQSLCPTADDSKGNSCWIWPTRWHGVSMMHRIAGCGATHSHCLAESRQLLPEFPHCPVPPASPSLP